MAKVTCVDAVPARFTLSFTLTPKPQVFPLILIVLWVLGDDLPALSCCCSLRGQLSGPILLTAALSSLLGCEIISPRTMNPCRAHGTQTLAWVLLTPINCHPQSVFEEDWDCGLLRRQPLYSPPPHSQMRGVSDISPLCSWK